MLLSGNANSITQSRDNAAAARARTRFDHYHEANVTTHDHQSNDYIVEVYVESDDRLGFNGTIHSILCRP